MSGSKKSKAVRRSPRPRNPVYIIVERDDIPEEEGRWLLFERSELGQVLASFNDGLIAAVAASACNTETAVPYTGEASHGFTLLESGDKSGPAAWIRQEHYFQNPIPVARFYDLDCARRTFAALRPYHSRDFEHRDIRGLELWAQHNIYSCCRDGSSHRIFTAIAETVAAIHAEGDVELDAENLEEYVEPCVLRAASWLARHNMTVDQFLAQNGIDPAD